MSTELAELAQAIVQQNERTQVIKCKCLNCDLHFTGYSFRASWRPRHCPECGKLGPYVIWTGDSNRFIYELVPGGTPLTEHSYHPQEGT